MREGGAVVEKELSTNRDNSLAQLIVFKISNQEFGVYIEEVQEIIKMAYITPIPEAPKFIKGLVNVRGDIVPTIDLRSHFHLPEINEVTKHIILTRQDGTLCGLAVGEVIEVLRINKDEMKPAPKIIEAMRKFVIGAIVYNERLIVVLALSKILAEAELMKFYQEDTIKNGKASRKVKSHNTE